MFMIRAFSFLELSAIVVLKAVTSDCRNGQEPCDLLMSPACEPPEETEPWQYLQVLVHSQMQIERSARPRCGLAALPRLSIAPTPPMKPVKDAPPFPVTIIVSLHTRLQTDHSY